MERIEKLPNEARVLIYDQEEVEDAFVGPLDSYEPIGEIDAKSMRKIKAKRKNENISDLAKNLLNDAKRRYSK